MNLRPGVLVVLVPVAVVGALLAVGRRSATPVLPGGQHLGIPAYFYPDQANVEQWQRLRQGVPAVRTAIVTGLDLRGDGPIEAYRREIVATHQAGVEVLAYITTRSPGNGPTLPAVDIRSGVDQAYAWYGAGGVLDGIFFDEAVDYPVTCDQRQLFVDLDRHVKSKGGRGITVINHGQAVPECYATAADILVNAETTYDLYKRWRPAGWERRYPAAKFWHLVHGAATVEQMREVVTLSVRRRAGTVYVTGGPARDPYGALPPSRYWADELAAVARR